MEQRTPEDGATPLYIAAKYGHVEVIKLLLQAPGIEVGFSQSFIHMNCNACCRLTAQQCVA